MLKSIIKNIVVFGLFIVPFVPLIITDSLFFPFITGKAFVFRVVVEIIFASWLILAFLDQKYRPRISWISGSVFLFLSIIFLANIFGVNPYLSFWSNLERMEGFMTLVHLGMFFTVMSFVFDTKLWKKFFLVSIGVSIIISIYSLLQLFGKIDIRQGGVRVDGTMGNAIYLALYLMFHFFITLFYFFKSQTHKIIYFLILLLQSVIIYFTASRGVILGLIGGLCITFLLIFLLEKNRKILKRNVGVLLLFLIVIVSVFYLTKNSEFVRSNQTLGRFSELSFNEIKHQGRFFIWPMAIEGFKDHPLLGYGQENFVSVFNTYYNPKAYTQEPWFDRVHNTFLDWLVVGGILGLLSYIFILFSLFFALWKSSISVIDKSVLTGLCAGYIFQSIFVFDNLTSYIMFFATLAFVCYLTIPEDKVDLGRKNVPLNKQIVSEKTINYLVLPIVSIVLLFVIYFVNIGPYRSSALMIKAMCPRIVTEIGPNGKKIKVCETNNLESLTIYKKVFAINSLASKEALFQFLNKTLDINRDKNVSVEIKQGYLNLSEAAIDSVLKHFSLDSRTLILIGSFYSKLITISKDQGDTDMLENYFKKSLPFLEKAKEISPKRQDVYFELSSLYLAHDDLDSTFANVKIAFDLEPNNPEARTRLAFLLIYLDKFEEAYSILDENNGDLYFDPRIMNVLSYKKQNAKIIFIWEKRVLANPENSTFRKALVVAYIKNNQLQKAISQLEEIIKIEPDFKSDAEAMIVEIKAGRGQAIIAN